MLVMSRLFHVLFFFFCNFVLCDKKGTSEKKNCPTMNAISVALTRQAWTLAVPMPCRRWRGWNGRSKDLMSEPVVLKANERYSNSRLLNLGHPVFCFVFYFHSRTVRWPLLPAESPQEVAGTAAPREVNRIFKKGGGLCYQTTRSISTLSVPI